MHTLGRFARAPARPAAPQPGEIHVWAVPLEAPAARVEALAALLAADESARAARLRFPRHRRRFTVGRGALRTLIGRYLDLAPEAVAFRYGPKGKPYLDGAAAAAGLELNLSNSGDLAVVAFSRRVEVGVDLERLRPQPEALAIAERFFSPAERGVLRGLEGEERMRAFFRCWTRKEAFLKALGAGITVPLDAFDVSLGPGEAPALARIEGDAARAAGWTLWHLEPAPGYLGAVALPRPPGEGWRATGWRWWG